MDGSGSDPGLRLTGKLHSLALAGLQYARARIELLQHEISEEKSRVGQLLLRGALFVFAALTTYQLIAAFIVAAFWDTAWRLHAIAALVLLTGALCWWAWTAVLRCANDGTEPLAATLKEFDKDREALQRLASDDMPAAAATADPSMPASPAGINRDKPYANRQPVGT